MPGHCFLYYITDRSQFAGSAADRTRALIAKVREAARAGVDYIQLREKDLSTRELESLARDAVREIAGLRTEKRALETRLLINSRTDVALAVGADGVHLRSDDVSARDANCIMEALEARGPQEVKSNSEQAADRSAEPMHHANSRVTMNFSAASGTMPSNEATSRSGALSDTASPRFTIGVSCHSSDEVFRVERDGGDFAVFAPVFEKNDPASRPRGLDALRDACRARIPVLALGGVTLANAAICLEADAAGIAGIRLFQENDVSEVVAAIRELTAKL